MNRLPAFIAMLALPTPCIAGDLTKIYPATLDYFEGQPTREWTCTKSDVWALKSFHYQFKDKLDLALGPSNVVFGVYEKNVVWAAVIPDKPGTIKTKLAGDGEHVASIWMRFNPVHVGELFPTANVGKNGPEETMAWAKRMCTLKISSGWQANDLPVIPKKSSIVLDCETVEKKRRYYTVDTDANKVEIVDAFTERILPALVPMTRPKALEAFNAAWEAFDKEYAKFGIRPDVDWDKLGARYRKQAEMADTTFESAAAISALVSELRDLHVWVKAGDEFVSGYNRQRPLNASFEATKKAVGGLTDTKHDILWGRTKDKLGYVNVTALEDADLPRTFDDVLEQLGDTVGLVIDLRFNGGGDEIMAQKIAGRFLDKKRVYSLNQYRSGSSKHDDLGPKLERAFEPRGPWRYEAPLVALQGQKTFSSAESFALMLAQCPQVTTMGDRTAGSSANPRLLELEGNIKVNLPRWLDMDPSGKSIEDVGIDPKVKVDIAPEKFTNDKDPVIDAALELLRKTPAEKRAPGKRGG